MIEFEGNYHKGRKHGICRSYDQQGILDEQVYYLHGKEQDDIKVFTKEKAPIVKKYKKRDPLKMKSRLKDLN